MRDKVDAAECKLKEIWAHIKSTDLIPEHAQYKAYGKFASRLMLMLLDKQLQGIEQKQYTDIDEIEKLFCVEHADLMTKHIGGTSAGASTSEAAWGMYIHKTGFIIISVCIINVSSCDFGSGV